MRIALTGHRPDKLGGYEAFTTDTGHVLINKIEQLLRDNKCTTAITGMAQGADWCMYLAALRMGAEIVCAVPFEGQESMWPASVKAKYIEMLSAADEVVHVCEPGYAVWKMQKRNEWMVDNCDVLIAVWDGSSGGTANCVKYAQKVGRKIVYVNPKDITNENLSPTPAS